MQSVAFTEGETLTYLQGQRDWIVVSGIKDDRIFYRKATIACDGKVWHHIAFEYPSRQRQDDSSFVMLTITTRNYSLITASVTRNIHVASEKMIPFRHTVTVLLV